MVRELEQHGWEIPEGGDEDYPEVLDTLFENIDRNVIMKGELSGRPTAGVRGRWYLVTDNDPPTLHYDNGVEWVGIATDVDLPDNVLLTDEDQTVDGNIEFRQEVDGDISGTAAEAAEADEAGLAEDTDNLGGVPGTEYVRRDRTETIEGERDFEEDVVFQNGLTIGEGILSLPSYENADPSNEVIEEPCIWFRADHQPS